MINKKSIIIAAVLTALATSFSVAEANSTSNLLQMDVKRSSVTDSVDVTFYTTGEAQNTVVTRKSPNRYVVLLPNVSGSSSIVPSLGGVKDLITDIQVKNIDDGIGGYTKITFGTTKPVNIRTYMKKTSPLTQAQKDYKNLIAQNNKPAAQTKPVEHKASTTTPSAQNKTTAKPAATKPTTTTKSAKSNEVKVSNKTNTQNNKLSLSNISFTPISIPKLKSEQPKTTQKAAPKTATKAKPVQPKVQQQTPTTSKTTVSNPLTDSNYVPKMKFDANGKREIDLEPRVTHEIVKEKQNKMVKTDPTFAISEDNLAQAQDNTVQEQPVAEETPKTETSSNNFHLPIWLMAISGAALGLLVLFLVFDAVSHASEKDADRLKSFFNISSKNQARRRNREFTDIINDDNLNWQEKYKKYTETDKKLHPVEKSKDMSYVTDMSASKKAIVTPNNEVNTSFGTDRRALHNEQLAQNLNIESNNHTNTTSEVENSTKVPTKLDFKQVADSIKNIPEKRQEEIRENLQAKISQMEHALAQTPQMEPPEEVSNEVKSEDDAIMGTFNDIKLKSFSKTVTLKETHRNLIEEDKKQSRNKSYKEGRFVKLKNSPLSVSRRQSKSSELAVSDLVNTGNKYLNNNNGEMKMDKENENYLLSSLDEYMSILDSEDEKRTATMQKDSVAETLAQVRPSEAMSRSGITNPISRAKNPMNRQKTEPTHYMNGLIVKSGYNIDAEKGFYVVNLDGVSALVGRVKDDIFILKKFDYVVDKPLQVRLDYGSVYIVKVGGFKCLVDVSKNKMGTLIEI